MHKTLYHIGCSGYYYAEWKNHFYPKEVKQKDWLAYYSTIFNTVELNGTFYHTPKVADLKRNAQVTSKDFKFSVKVNRYITHLIKLKNSNKEIRDFQDLINEGLGNKRLYFLFQLPPSFHYNEENLERIIANIPNQSSNVVELRHASWWNEDVQKAFTKARLTFCNVDFPGLATYFIHSSPHFYLRLHGNPDLFRSPYSKESLREFHKKFPTATQDYNIYFNNTANGAAPIDALELAKIING